MADTHQGNPFVDQLLHDLRLDQLPEPKRSQLLNKITEVAEQRVLQTIMMNMDKTALAEFEQKLQAGMTEDEAANFMIEKVPSLSAKVEVALTDLYTRLVADIGQIDQQIAAMPAATQPAASTTPSQPPAAPLVVPTVEIPSTTTAPPPPTPNQPTS